MLDGKKIFITGGAGFIGSATIGELVERNRIVVYDNFERNALQARPFADHANLTLVEGDVLDGARLAAALRDADPTHVIHCAAIAGIDTVIQKPVRTMQVNLTGTGLLFQASAELSRLERVVSFSTSEVFGSHAFLSAEKDSAVVGRVGEARWTYAVSKLAGEHLALAYHRQMDLPVVVLRPFNVYGPGQVGEGALSIFIQRALAGAPISIHGTGTQIRAWCYIDDMVRGVLLALEHSRAVGESFNIGNQKAVTTIYGLASTVVRVLDSPSAIEFIPWDHADVELRVPNCDKAREVLGFAAEIELEEGIRRTAAALRGTD